MRLEELEEQLGDKVSITWRSFLLRPESEERDMAKFAKYTESWSRPAEVEPKAGFAIPWSEQHAPPGGSMEVAVAGRCALTFGEESWRAFHREMLDAYFVKHLTVSDREVQLDVAEVAGISREAFGVRLDDMQAEFTKSVIDDHNAAIEAGVSGVPAVVVDDKYLVGGAVDTAHYVKVIEHVLTEREAGYTRDG